MSVGILIPAFQLKDGPPHYKVLPPALQGNLTVFPVVSATTFDTALFYLDEGVRSGEVIVTETGQVTGLVRPARRLNDGVWRERPMPIPAPLPEVGAQVNELSLINNSDRPLVLLAGEIVTGGKQDRVVSKDRIIPAHSQPVALGVFSVEPHRWTQTSARFKSFSSSMAQPSVRSKAMADKDQQQVWNEVAKSRSAVIEAFPAAAMPLQLRRPTPTPSRVTRSKARSIGSLNLSNSRYDTLIQKLRAEHAVGAVVAVNGEIVWADVFASSDLLNRFWPKLIRSYAAESLDNPCQWGLNFGRRSKARNNFSIGSADS